MITAQELKAGLANCYGSEQYHKLTLSPLKSTDGVATMAQLAGAFWLVDAIASYQGDKRIKHLQIQFWHLVVKDKRAELFVQEDSGMPKLITQKIGYTDFPEGEWELILTDNVLMLPSEN